MRTFTVGEARDQLRLWRPMLDEFITVRADAAELTAALHGTAPPTPLGGLPELKAAQARIDDFVGRMHHAGVQVKGIAPLLLDFPGRRGDDEVLFCWLEGEAEIGWYHRFDLGFPGRRPLD